MIWNNGDGNDDNLGGDGVDETLITAGTANDSMTVKPQGAVTRFDRSNAAVQRQHEHGRAARHHVLLRQRQRSPPTRA